MPFQGKLLTVKDVCSHLEYLQRLGLEREFEQVTGSSLIYAINGINMTVVAKAHYDWADSYEKCPDSRSAYLKIMEFYEKQKDPAPVRLRLIKEPSYEGQRFQGGEIFMFSLDSRCFNKARLLFPEGAFREADIGRKTPESMRIFCNTGRIEALLKLSDNLQDVDFTSDLQLIRDRLREISSRYEPSAAGSAPRLT